MDKSSSKSPLASWMVPALVGAVLVLVASNAAITYRLIARNSENSAQQPVNSATDVPTVNPPVISTPGQQLNPVLPLKADEISVEWTDWPQKLNEGIVSLIADSAELGARLAADQQFVDTLSGPSKTEFRNPGSKAALTIIRNFLVDHSTYLVGHVTGGKYQGGDLYRILSNYCPEMCTTTRIMVVVLDGRMTVLTAYSDELYYNAEKLLFPVSDATTRIQGGVLPPETIAIPGAAPVLIQAAWRWQMLIDVTDAKLMFTTAQGQKVYRGAGCFLVAAKDGMVVDYKWRLGFLPADESRLFGVLAATWSDGSANKDEYALGTTMGCGRYCHSFADYVTNAASQLVTIGKTASGETLFGLKADIMAESAYDKPVLAQMYDNYYPGYDEATKQTKAKMTFDEFLKMRPLVFWKDPLGNWLSFARADIAPAAECGKPVIYLYPEKTTEVSVKVEPTGGLSVSEPAYDGGWKVQASPNGDLKNLADGSQWPYLFWEGFGMKYSRPSEGFVVPREKVEAFLRNALAKQGLIAKEYEEFIAFWLPKMQEKPWYFITFVPQAEFDKMAPLSVSPAPQTVIRVFMDYEGLDAPVSVRPQQLDAPARNGFTVVEWGGALHR